MVEVRRDCDGYAAEGLALRPPYGEALVRAGVVGALTLAILVALPFSDLRPLVAAGAVYGLATAAALVFLDRHPHARFGGANTVTLVRLGGVALFTALAIEPDLLSGTGAWLALAAAVGLLSLDGIDGWFARRQNTASDYGARFDMEVDALFILVLAIIAVKLGETGLWVLGLGVIRYAFVAAAWVWPRLAAPLPWSRRRKTVCVLQVAVLTVLLAPAVVPPVSGWLTAAALAALIWSFAVDIRWLLSRPEPPR